MISNLLAISASNNVFDALVLGFTTGCEALLAPKRVLLSVGMSLASESAFFFYVLDFVQLYLHRNGFFLV